MRLLLVLLVFVAALAGAWLLSTRGPDWVAPRPRDAESARLLEELATRVPEAAPEAAPLVAGEGEGEPEREQEAAEPAKGIVRPPAVPNLLLVDVRDPAGEPVEGLRVELVGVGTNRTGVTEEVGEAVSDATGLARVPTDDLPKIGLRALRFRLLLRYEVRAKLQAGEVEPVVLGPKVPPGTRVTLVTPPVGRVTVDVRTPDGAPFGGPGEAWLFHRELGSDEPYARGANNIVDIVDGRAVFDAVGLGLELRINCSDAERRHGSAGTVFPGPTAAGQEVRAECALTLPPARVRGRLLREDGAPLADAELLLRTLVTDKEHPGRDESQRISGGTSVETDAEGRFEIVVPPYQPRWQRTYQFLHGHDRRFPDDPHGAGSVSVDLSFDVPLGTTHSVGDLRLTPLPLTCAGVVVDSSGAPVAQAYVFVRRTWSAPYPRRGTKLHNHWIQTGPDGRFECHLPGITGKLCVDGRVTGSLHGSVDDVPVGTDDVRLMLLTDEESGPTGLLEGRVLVDNFIPAGALHVVLGSTDGPRRDREVVGGHFRFDRQGDATVWIEVQTQSTDFALARVEGIETRDRETVRAPSIQEIDLRGRLSLLSLRVLDEDGEPLKRTVCWIRDERGGGSDRTDDEGRLVLVLPRSSGTFWLSTNEHRPYEFTHSDDELEVRLELKD